MGIDSHVLGYYLHIICEFVLHCNHGGAYSGGLRKMWWKVVFQELLFKELGSFCPVSIKKTAPPQIKNKNKKKLREGICFVYMYIDVYMCVYVCMCYVSK